MIYSNELSWDENNIKAMSKDAFIAMPTPSWDGKFTASQQLVLKSKVYDKVTLSEDAFLESIKNGVYTLPNT